MHYASLFISQVFYFFLVVALSSSNLLGSVLSIPEHASLNMSSEKKKKNAVLQFPYTKNVHLYQIITALLNLLC